MSSPKCLVHVLYLVSSTQFAVCSPQCLFNTDRVNRYQSCLFRVCARRRAFINKTRTITLFANTSFLRLAFGIIATGHFHFRNNETQDMLLYQSNPVGVKLFSYLNTLVGFMLHNFCTEIQASEVKLQISSFDLFNRTKCKFWSKRRGYSTTRSQTTAFCSYEKLYTFRKYMSARFLNVISTDLNKK